jgi:hypothetical protein
MTDEIHDFSRLDRWQAAKRRAMVAHEIWKPMAAGAAGAAVVVAAVYVTLPRFSTREVIVDHIVQKDVSVDHVVPRDVLINNPVPHDVPFDVPRAVSAAPASPQERSFVASEGWKDSVIRGRILREEGRGFVMLTDQGERRFSPATIGSDGRVKPSLTMRDDVSNAIGLLAHCGKLPSGVYDCVAMGSDGREFEIPQVPAGAPL